jgi:hypothetical protein
MPTFLSLCSAEAGWSISTIFCARANSPGKVDSPVLLSSITQQVTFQTP